MSKRKKRGHDFVGVRLGGEFIPGDSILDITEIIKPGYAELPIKVTYQENFKGVHKLIEAETSFENFEVVMEGEK